MTYKPTGRRPGAPNGNTNHLKHGIYSRHISVEDNEELDTMSQVSPTAELALARNRISKCLEKEGSISGAEWAVYERAISYYITQINNMLRQNALLGSDNKEALLTVMDFVHQANEDQHVVLD